MRVALFVCLAVSLGTSAHANDWRVQRVDTPARIAVIDTVDGRAAINAGGLWYGVAMDGANAKLVFIEMPARPVPPAGALPDGHVATGKRDIARAWLAEPTERYGHAVLGDAIEAGSLVIETRDGKTHTVRLKGDAVFEDLEPRLADLDGDGRDEVIVVKSYLRRGASLAVVALRKGRYAIVAETPPLGGAHRWLNPAGIADFTGDGKSAVALVRQPHVVGELQLWSYTGTALRKTAALPGVTNHILGARALAMSAVADFDGDGVADLALPSLDRTRMRIVSFAPDAREIASIPLPAKAVSNIALIANGKKPPAIAAGLADGTLVVIRRD